MTGRLDADAQCEVALAESPGAVNAVRDLFREYQVSLGVDLEFQGFSLELAGLPGTYGRPAGALFLASLGRAPVGCVAVCRWDETRAEMKRLFVRPSSRGRGVGRALAQQAIASARDLGYQEILLDTLPSMTEAQMMYRCLGFVDTFPYRDNPVPGTRFLVCTL